MKEKILVSTSSFSVTSNEALEILNKSGYEIVFNPYGRKLTNQEMATIIDHKVIGIVAGLEELSENTLSGTNVRIISRVGSGTSNVDKKYISKKNIKLFTTPTAPINSVTEMTVANMINLSRHIFEMNECLHKASWSRMIGSEIYKKNIIIFGCGNIGKRIAKILNAFEANIYFVDPFNKKIDSKFEIISKDKALEIADIISIHVNVDEEIININDLKKMKKNIFLLNSSRGNCVNENTIVYGIENDIIKGVWVDAFENEPYEGRLSEYKNVILSPHAASFTNECRANMEKEAVINLLSFLSNE